MNEKIKQYPLIPMKDLVILPGMMVHFDVNRSITKTSVEWTMQREQKVLICLQTDQEVVKEEYSERDLESVGVIAIVRQMVRLPKEGMRVMVMALEPADVLSIEKSDAGIHMATVSLKEDKSLERFNDIESKGLLANIRDVFSTFADEDERLNKVKNKIIKIKNLDQMIQEVAINVIYDNFERQQYLYQEDNFTRYVFLVKYMLQGIDVLRIKKDLQQKLKTAVDQNQKEYYMKEQMKVIRRELGEDDLESEADQFMEQLGTLCASEEVKSRIEKEIRRFRSLPSGSENAVSRAYVETLLELPWDKMSTDHNGLARARKILERDHYGMEKVKERILEFLAVRAMTTKGESPIICLVGPPGTGKTSIARSVADALSKKYVRICLGGVRDEAEIRGHRRTYVGALPGRIIEGIKSAGVKNPLMLLDEIDKAGNDRRGDTASALLEVLDGEQNKHFKDHYVEIPVDLSEVLFIATANDASQIPRPLLDRMELIEIAGYTENEKFHIAKKHLYPKQLKANGLTKKQLSISDKAFRKIIAEYTREAGVRGLERKISAVMRKAACQIYERMDEEDVHLKEKVNVAEEASDGFDECFVHQEEDKAAGSTLKALDTRIKITDRNLSEYLGMPRYDRFLRNKKAEVGIVRGLAWTSVGGVTLEIEAVLLEGQGALILTGKLGEVMQESAKASLGYIRSISKNYHLDNDFFKNHDIHIHIPEGATPKDGPSAGITMTLAMISAITNQKVRADIAMTGEVTLRGRVLPIGGVKEKLLAAKLAGMTQVLVPKANEKDVVELEKEITEGMEVTFVEHMDEVLKVALCGK